MRSSILFCLLAIVLWMILASWWFNNSSCNNCHSSKIIPDSKTINNITDSGLKIQDANDWSLIWNDNIRFKKSSEVPVIALDLMPCIDSIGNNLINNHNQKLLTIVGNYGAAEINNTTFKNIGIARAEQIKSILINKGYDRNLIFTESKLNEPLIAQFQDSIWGGIDFRINTINADLELSEENLLQARNVYFQTGRNSITITPELDNYFTKAKSYLDTHPDKFLEITGHTDNVGDANKNIKLSKERAEFVKSELTKKAILKERIKTDGFGDSKPLMSNDNQDGRDQNRRVEIKIN